MPILGRPTGRRTGLSELEELGDQAKRLLVKGAAHAGRFVAQVAIKYVSLYRTAREFESDWKWTRLVVPLQVRLLVEQVLWDKRGGWRDLVTGFGPVKGRNK